MNRKCKVGLKDWINKNIRYSVKGKYVAVIILGVLAASLLVGMGTSVLMLRKVAADTTETMNLHCKDEGDVVNDSLSSTKQSVTFMKQFAENKSADYESLKNDEAYRTAFEESLIEMYEKIALSTSGATTFYVRYDPDNFDPKGGFLYSREYSHESIEAGYTRLEVTDLSKMDRDDESVEWFYKPLNEGVGMWISPYWGDNLQMNMISYVEPVSVDGRTIGIVGMDVDFDKVLEKIGESSLYESGYAFLVGSDGDVVTSNYVNNKDAVTVGKEEVEQFYGQLKGDSSAGRLISYVYKGDAKRLVYYTLNNEMKLVLVADSDEIFAEVNSVMFLTLVIALAIAVSLSVTGYRMASALTRPISEISDVAVRIGAGEFDMEIPELDRKDEVGDLARAFQNTSAHLQLYVDYIQNLAYKDALTDVQNRAAYEMSREQLDVDIRMGKARFAIIMIDLNRLKKINDTYGHEIGNRYIINLCAKITDIFAVETVYRIGGDEFIVLLKEADYDKREELLERLRKHLDVDVSKIENPWDNVSAATGMSEYKPEVDGGTDEVFKRADEEMYKNKAEMKAAGK